MKSFGSDNYSGIHPDILKAIEAANMGHAPAYGDDPWTGRAVALFRELFEKEDLGVYFVFNGTGANILSLSSTAASFNAVVCTDTAHINVDECGAPEKALGSKLIDIPNADGKLTPGAALSALEGFGSEHHVQPAVISISQTTEMGTLYSIEEITALADLAHSYGMYLHVDGARIANALAASGASPRAMIADTGVDLLSFGGTKNGMMIGEAVLVFNPELNRNFLYRRKQSMQLFSKMRFISAQFSAYLSDSLWLRLATHANHMAAKLHEALMPMAGIKISRPCHANAVFAILPPEVTKELREMYSFHVWNEQTGEVRWMCSFDTTPEDVEEFTAAVKDALERFMKKTCAGK